ncbi:MAG: hypothetical protein RIA65_05825, partial [Woeseia sp.]
GGWRLLHRAVGGQHGFRGGVPALLLAGRAAATSGAWRQQPHTRRFAGIVLLVSGVIALYLPLAHLAGDHVEPELPHAAMHQHGRD